MVIAARSGASAANHELRELHLGTSPYEDIHAVAVELSANTQQFTSDSVKLSLLPLPTFSAYSPSTGRSDGGTLVVLSGENFFWGTDFKLNVAGSIVNASMLTPNMLLSITPPSGLGAQGARRLSMHVAPVGLI